MIVTLGQAGIHIDDSFVPDISVGICWAKHWNESFYDTTSVFDTLKVQVTNSSGTVLATLATYSNLNKNNGYHRRRSTFVLDDFALTVQ